MGYDSSFSGSMSPSKRIPQSVARIINEANRDVCVFLCADNDTQGIYDNEDYGNIIPSSNYMHGYSIVEDLMVVQNMLRPHGILLTGEIIRVGEGDVDYEKIEAVKGKIFVSRGEIVYRNREQVSPERIRKYVIAVYKKAKTKTRTVDKQIGWVSTRCANGRSVQSVVSDWENGKGPFRRTPPGADVYTHRKDAVAAMKKFSRKTYTCKIVTLEDML